MLVVGAWEGGRDRLSGAHWPTRLVSKSKVDGSRGAPEVDLHREAYMHVHTQAPTSTVRIVC